MNFLKKLFQRTPKPYVDERGIYFHVACKRCQNTMRIRADRQYDLNRSEDGSGYVWRKTIVCDKCFSKMEATVLFSGSYAVTNREIAGGVFVEAPSADVSDSNSDSSRGFG